MNALVSLALLFLVSVYSTEGLSCYCRTLCSDDEIERIRRGCNGGIVDDACHCCKTCAKVEGETCGGLWALEGKCDQGLFCKTPGEPRRYSMRRGICVKSQITEVAKSATETLSSSGDESGDYDDDTTEESSGEETERPTEPLTEPSTEPSTEPFTEPSTEPPADYLTTQMTTAKADEEIIIF